MREMPFGTWPGEITARDIAAGGLRFGGLVAFRDGLAWIEGRPDEGGRGVIVFKAGAGRPVDLLPPPFSARSRVNEYGGGALWVDGDGLIFVNDADQDLYRIIADGGISRLTDRPDCRFADGTVAADRHVVVVEADTGGRHPSQSLASVDIGSGALAVIAEGRDFFAAPRLSPDGLTLVWLAWDLPHMPWQAAELWMATLDEAGRPGPARLIGGGLNRAAFQPEWSPSGVLHCVLEGNRGGRLHQWGPGGWQELSTPPGECGRPMWALATRSYALAGDGRVIVSRIEDGAIFLEEDGAALGAVSDCGAPAVLADGGIACLASWPDRPESIAVFRSGSVESPGIVRPSGTFRVAPESFSAGTLKRFETADGPVHALYYPPAMKGVAGPAGDLPPMLVSAHGGPTGYAGRGFAPKIQFWTQRGFAFLDVDYRGSFGYGPDYRRALDGHLGLRDIRDTVAAAQAAAAEGLADPERLLISGGSAGGYVVLGALAFHGAFRAGCSRYGIGDLKVLAKTTHKFEAGYLDTLLGLIGDPEHDDAIMAARSPLNAVDRITAPILLLQGLDDRIVPPKQSRDMFKALKSNGNPVALVEFEGEGHGFRMAETVIAALELEYAFYCRILGLTPDQPLRSLEIENWEDAD